VWSSPLFGALAHAGIELCALVGGVALAVAAIAASAQPSDTPTDSVPPPTRAQQLVPKSDEDRIVGKVLELDREAGRVKLATEEAGVVTFDVLGQAARAFRVGDTVSVSRSSIQITKRIAVGSDRGSGSSDHEFRREAAFLAAHSQHGQHTRTSVIVGGRGGAQNAQGAEQEQMPQAERMTYRMRALREAATRPRPHASQTHESQRWSVGKTWPRTRRRHRREPSRDFKPTTFQL
jgi:hypothetical protein